jgi:hypothetical protein
MVELAPFVSPKSLSLTLSRKQADIALPPVKKKICEDRSLWNAASDGFLHIAIGPLVPNELI